MRIAHIVSTFPPYYGGMGNVVFQTAEHLSMRGHDVMVYTPQYYRDTEIRDVDAPEATVHSEAVEEQLATVERLSPSLEYGNAARIPTVTEELDTFDIVHLHYPFFGTANLVRKWKLRHPEKPLVITYHMDARSPGWKGLVFKWYAKHWMPKILDAGDLLIGSSLDYIKHSDAAFHLAEAPEKWVGLPFGVDCDRFTPRESARDLFFQHGLEENKPTLLFVGGMDAAHHFKGVPVLLEAVRVLKRNGFEVQCVFVGDGELREEFALRAKGYGVSAQVRFVGYVSDEELPFYYNMADMTVLPSTTAGEAFGMVLLESMASGVPVLASDIPGVRRVAADGGMVFPPKNAEALAESIARYFDKQTNRVKWRKDVREIAEGKYSWEGVAESLEKLYLEL